MSLGSKLSPNVSLSVSAAASAVLKAKSDPSQLKRRFEHNDVPMVMVDAKRRYVEVNRPARLWFRLTLEEMRAFAIGELTPAPPADAIEQDWARMLDTGCVSGRYPVIGPDGSQFDVVYSALAEILPGLHLVAFAPAPWHASELERNEDAPAEAFTSLTPREVEVLALAAEGYSGPELAKRLVLSPGTVNTHFKHIHEKLGVRTRAAAVAKAMRRGLIA